MRYLSSRMDRRSMLRASACALSVPLIGTASARRQVLAQDASPKVEPNPDISGTITVGMVGNAQMIALQDLVAAGAFAEVYPNVTVDLTVLPENEIRQTIARDVVTQAGQFDAFTVGPFEVPIWARQGFLREVGEMVVADPDYDLDDVFESQKASISYDGGLYGLPFYGESAIMFYRKDLFEEAGLTMPERPSWEEIAEFAAALHKPGEVSGIALRGLPSWSLMGASLTTVINAFGGRWYDEDWNAALSQSESAEAIRFYIEILQRHGPEGVEQNGFTENLTLFTQGQIAQWYDATPAAELLSSPEENPEYADKIGFAYAPSKVLPSGNWLSGWNFAMAATTKEEEATLAFMKWATSKEYQKLIVAADGSWGRAPTGARQSTYSDPDYLAFSSEYAEIVRNAIDEVNPTEPTAQPVPYVGGWFVSIPEFPQLGDDVMQELASALVGAKPIDDAIDAANDLANQVALEGGYQ